MKKEKKWVTVREYIEARPGLLYGAIRQYCRAGKIPNFMQGHKYMFDPAEMDAYLEWKAKEGMRYKPGEFAGLVKETKSKLTSIAAYRARQKEEVGT